MINQFLGLPFEDSILAMDGGSVETVNTGGDLWLSAYNLPRIDFGGADAVKIFDIFILFLFAIVYDFFGWRLIEKNRDWFFNQTRLPVSTVKQSFSMSTPAVMEISGKDNCSKGNVNEKTDTDWPQSLSVVDLCYDVPVKRGVNILKKCRKRLVRFSGNAVGKKPEVQDLKVEDNVKLRLLHKVSACFSRGRMTCMMGTSGAGKTTLMDCIAGYKTGGTVHGDILIDGCKKDEKIWKKISGYAEQNDILNPYLTALETVRFTAECRLPKTKDRQGIIDRVLTLMNLNDWKNVIIGREVDGEGLPKHARKRLTIAIQLVIEPKILFLDEPTTGLSQTAARLVIDSMTTATRALGLITVATIHQPSQYIWNAFDDVLLLVRGGRVAYMGESGMKSSTILGHFQPLSKSGIAPDGWNPSDYCLTVLNNMDPKDAEDSFEKSDLKQSLLRHIGEQKENARQPPAVDLKRVNNIFVEIGLLTVRHLVVQWRNPSYCFMRIMSSIAMSFYIAILFAGDKTVLSGAVFTIGAIFFLVFVLVIPMQAAVVPLIEDRAVLYRETVSGTYGRLSYGIGQLLADQPFHLLNTFLMWVFFYFLVDFRQTGEEMGYFLLMLYLSNWVIQSLGQLFALATPNEESANGLGGLSVILSVILMGFLITVDSMPDGWVWAYWVNLFHYILQGLVTNELGDNQYFVNVTGLLPDLSDNSSSVLAFGEGVSQMSVQQVAGFTSLVAGAGGGLNPIGNLTGLLNCTLTEGCFADENKSPGRAFVECYLFSGFFKTPPCESEFSAVLSNVNFDLVLECLDLNEIIPKPDLFPDLGGASDSNKTETLSPSNGVLNITPQNRSLQSVTDLLPDFITNPNEDGGGDEGRVFDFALCMMKAVLPADTVDILQSIGEALAPLIPVVVELVDQGGFYLPGEVILFFFGWAKFEPGEGFVSPWKWWYCMSAVAIFLGSIEIFKLIAIRFIVWTKR